MNEISSIQLKNFLFFNLFIPASFFLFTIYFMPIEQVFQFDTSDEGIELIKASLHLQGFAMYADIWNDQPPLSTIILSFWLDLFGKSIFAARLLTLSFSTILVWSFCQILRIYLGNFPAIVGTLLLIISCNFLRLSISVMIGLPALALAMLSIYIFTLYKQKFSFLPIIISGSLLALSLQIKLFTAFLVPLIIFEFVQLKFTKYSQQQPKQNLFLDILLWVASVSFVFIIIGILCKSLNSEQLLQSHLETSVKTAFSKENSLKLTLLFFLQDFDYLLLAIPAIINIIKKRQWEKSLPIIWLSTVFILLINHRPVWYHHYLLISIPLTWLATYGITLSSDFFQQSNWYSHFKPNRLNKLTLSGFAAGSLIFSILVTPIKLGVIQLENHRYIEKSQDNIQLVNLVLEHKKSTKWFFTDCPIYAFYSGLRVPPEIAVLSHIRIESKTITRERLLSVFETYNPEQVLVCKSQTIHEYLNSYLDEHYLKIYQNHAGTHYLLKN
ncbi:MAG: glycosyltransferase family 39 protein [Cyanomargarita calcarea GSE-NOS-MK-12-04C]|uniref:Glycosyltransferase family 39 protein n=1 Tax=Cyanomargarita calcarea GSE-NOS-MK-12-04C TaxID=2839659 RepID=A0A951UWM8_9CYAN|nr:glycosyltransferase family 39 protein [Cyanomargarita calcarea GSE-NOS-MK-12-04C]